jgi:hypothetical protein
MASATCTGRLKGPWTWDDLPVLLDHELPGIALPLSIRGVCSSTSPDPGEEFSPPPPGPPIPPGPLGGLGTILREDKTPLRPPAAPLRGARKQQHQDTGQTLSAFRTEAVGPYSSPTSF